MLNPNVEKWLRIKGDLEYNYVGKQKEPIRSKVNIDFFIPDREKDIRAFNRERFIEDYKTYYYLGNTGRDCPKRINSRNQSYEGVEDILFTGKNSIIEKKEDWALIDVLNILAWKTGNIDHSKSKKDEEIRYKAGWFADEEKGEYGLKLRAYSLSGDAYSGFAKKVCNIRKQYSENSQNDDSLWQELIRAAQPINGLGPVYLITLLFFITRGRYPIYDRFAMAALLSLLANEKGYNIPYDDSIIRIASLPEKTESTDLYKLKMYDNYIGLLYHFFGESWINNRDIDRALWVYGHFFNVQQ